MSIAPDKLAHLVTGIGIAFFLSILLCNPAFAFVITWAIGWGKELRDKRHPDSHTYDPKDAAFTAYGGAIGSVIGLVVLVELLGWL